MKYLIWEGGFLCLRERESVCEKERRRRYKTNGFKNVKESTKEVYWRRAGGHFCVLTGQRETKMKKI